MADPQPQLAQYERVLAQDPNNVDALCGKATALSLLGRFTEARAVVQRAFELDPRDSNVQQARNLLLAMRWVYCSDASGTINAFHADSGNLTWRYGTDAIGSCIRAVANDLIYVTRGLWGVGGVIALRFGEEVWRLDSRTFQSPTVDARAIYTSNRELLCASDAKDGSYLWETRLRGRVGEVCVANGIVYCCADFLYAINAVDGQVIWQRQVGRRSTVQYADSSTVYVTSRDKHAYAVNSINGEIRWRTKIGSFATLSSLVPQQVCLATTAKHVLGLDASTGSVLWHVQTGKEMSDWTSHAANMVLVPMPGGWLHALDAHSGSQIWRQHFAHNLSTAPLVDGADVYIGCGDGHICALHSADGTGVWQHKASGRIKVLAKSDPNHALYFTEGMSLTALDRGSGVQKWSRSPGGVLSTDGFDPLLFVM